MKSGRFYHILTPDDKKKIVKLHQDGVKHVRIAESFGVTPATISTIIRKFKKTQLKGGKNE